MNTGRIELRSGKQRLRVDRERIPQAGNIKLILIHLLFGDDDARLGLAAETHRPASAAASRFRGSRTFEMSKTGPPAESCWEAARARSIQAAGASPSATMRPSTIESRTDCGGASDNMSRFSTNSGSRL